MAVKVLPAHLSTSAGSRQRFEREAKTISQLSYPPDLVDRLRRIR